MNNRNIAFETIVLIMLGVTLGLTICQYARMEILLNHFGLNQPKVESTNIEIIQPAYSEQISHDADHKYDRLKQSVEDHVQSQNNPTSIDSDRGFRRVLSAIDHERSAFLKSLPDHSCLHPGYQPE